MTAAGDGGDGRASRSVGTYGWDGGLGTSWANDPAEDLVDVAQPTACLPGLLDLHLRRHRRVNPAPTCL
jgi:CubicO group peptidase (beta-lactamase class C family)